MPFSGHGMFTELDGVMCLSQGGGMIEFILTNQHRGLRHTTPFAQMVHMGKIALARSGVSKRKGQKGRH